MSDLIYQCLLTCRQVSLQAESRESSQMRWNHHGHGQVTVTEQNEYVRFQENLVLDNGGQAHDEKRWCWQPPLLTLERRREGRFQEIFCFELRGGQFILHQPHYCGEDVYVAELSITGEIIDLLIKIDGPRKKEMLHYRYQ